MNDIFSRVLQFASASAPDILVEDYVVGTGMTAVRLDDGSCGVAHLFREELPQGCSIFKSLIETPVPLLTFIRDTDPFHPVTSSLLLAASNAVINGTLQESDLAETDPFESLMIERDDIVGFVGDFRPLTSSLQGKVREVRIFERHLGEGYSPDWAIPFRLPECSCVVVTATSIMNRTIDAILECCNTERVIIMGPSAPMKLDFFPKKVHSLGGAFIVNSELAIQIASRAGGTKNLYSSGAAKKATILRRTC